MTPNLPEAAVLLGRPIENLAEAEVAAAALARKFGTACVLKGGHLAGAVITDLLYDGQRLHRFRKPRIATQTHGTGCTFAAALCAWLARGASLPLAVRRAQAYVHKQLTAQARQNSQT